jgi:hypothetical protein
VINQFQKFKGDPMKFLVLLGLVLPMSAMAISLKDYKPYDYQVYFTNPECSEYLYEEQVLANDGTQLSAKPKNVYCKAKDLDLNASRESSPHFHLLKLINDEAVSELFFTFLSFSEENIANAICDAIKQRNVKVTFIIDSKNESRDSSRKMLDYISTCRPSIVNAGEQINMPETYFRGNVGGIGFAHNKIILAKYKDDTAKVKVIFSSGNMSAGTSLHHENWHFVTTNIKSYFAQAHYCIKEGMINHSEKMADFKKFIKQCRKEIKEQAEDDIKLFIVPSDGEDAAKNISKYMENAIQVDGAAHRIMLAEVIDGMIKGAQNGNKMRFVVDDDIYWTGKRNVMTGANTFVEFANIMKMVRAGVEVRYMETNQNSKLLHHNKYLVFHMKDGSYALHAGAGNFTKSAFSTNLENFYFITIPEVVEQFKKQYDYKFTELATPYEKMPASYVNP